MGGLFQPFWERGGDFQELGPVLVLAPLGVSFSLLACYNELIPKIKV